VELYRGTAAHLSWQSVNGSLLKIAGRGSKNRSHERESVPQERISEQAREHNGTL
jgi:hypothetical protein